MDPKPCGLGGYCAAGSSQATPCPGGTYGNSTSLKAEDECTKVGPGFHSSLGSAKPEVCPVDAAGKPIDAFYCPGWEADTEFRGSKPLLVPTGQRVVTEMAEEVSASASFDPASFNETTTKAEFAAAVGAAAEDVVAEVVEAERTDIHVAFFLDQDADDFDEDKFRNVLAREADVDVSQVEVTVSAGSVVAEVTIRGASAAVAKALENGAADEAATSEPRVPSGGDTPRSGGRRPSSWGVPRTRFPFPATQSAQRRHVGRFAAGGDREAGYAVFGESD